MHLEVHFVGQHEQRNALQLGMGEHRLYRTRKQQTDSRSANDASMSMHIQREPYVCHVRSVSLASWKRASFAESITNTMPWLSL